MRQISENPTARRSVGRHVASIAIIAAPIALAQLAQMAMGVTDTLMLGGISERALAAGGLGAQIFFSVTFCLQGALSGVAVLIARALGAGDRRAVARIYWSGFLLALLLCVPLVIVARAPQALLRLAGEPANLAADTAVYLGVLAYGVPGAMLALGLLKFTLPAIGEARLLLWISPAAVALNAGLNVWFIHGGWFLPAYGLPGSAAASVVTLTLEAVMLIALLHGRRNLRDLARLSPVSLGALRQLMAIGLPVSITVIAEVSLFLAVGLTAGNLGEASLAAHTIAINVASISFMVPLAIAQAANVVVAGAIGYGSLQDARRAGLVAIGLGVSVMAAAAIVIALFAGPIAGLYLGGQTAPKTLALATSLLGIAAAFQLADGLQVVSSGALRGLADTRVPMLIALFGYWAIGLVVGRWLAFSQGFGVRGLWWGLFAGLATTGVSLLTRFLWRTRSRHPIAPPGLATFR